MSRFDNQPGRPLPESIRKRYRDLCLVCGKPGTTGRPYYRFHPSCIRDPDALESLGVEIREALARRARHMERYKSKRKLSA